MKASEAIAQLQALIATHGDQEVVEYNEDGSVWQGISRIAATPNLTGQTGYFGQDVEWPMAFTIETD